MSNAGMVAQRAAVRRNWEQVVDSGLMTKEEIDSESTPLHYFYAAISGKQPRDRAAPAVTQSSERGDAVVTACQDILGITEYDQLGQLVASGSIPAQPVRTRGRALMSDMSKARMTELESAASTGTSQWDRDYIQKQAWSKFEAACV